MILLKMLKTIVLLIWQLPQALLSLFVLFLILISPSKRTMKCLKGRILVLNKLFSVSLYPFTFVNIRVPDLGNTVKHEYGHVKQSMMLGPLYLFVVGIPSAFRAVRYQELIREGQATYRDYFNGYPEDWADKLGGVKR